MGDENNFIYLLGRNSSGKSSFLLALKHLRYGLVPRTHPRFANFEPTADEPSLLAEFSVGEGDITVDRLLDRFYTLLSDNGLEADIAKNAVELQPLLKEITASYQALIDQAKSNKRIWVQKMQGGSYRFLASQSDNNYGPERNE